MTTSRRSGPGATWTHSTVPTPGSPPSPEPAGATAAARAGPPRELDEAECRRLLGQATIGRISFTDGALPAIVPVPFALHAGQVLIPAERSSPMVDAVRGAVVAFGVDSYDAGSETGWNVTVVGPSRVLGDPEVLVGAPGTRLPRSWAGRDRCLITVQIGLLRGWYATEQNRGVPYHTAAPSAS